jgi:hypothetical protein
MPKFLKILNLNNDLFLSIPYEIASCTLQTDETLAMILLDISTHHSALFNITVVE